MVTRRKSLKRTVFLDEESGEMCFCEGDFWKTCSLRVRNQLPCFEAVVTITPVKRTETDPADPGARSLDRSLADLTDSLRHLESKFKI